MLAAIDCFITETIWLRSGRFRFRLTPRRHSAQPSRSRGWLFFFFTISFSSCFFVVRHISFPTLSTGDTILIRNCLRQNGKAHFGPVPRFSKMTQLAGLGCFLGFLVNFSGFLLFNTDRMLLFLRINKKSASCQHSTFECALCGIFCGAVKHSCFKFPLSHRLH